MLTAAGGPAGFPEPGTPRWGEVVGRVLALDLNHRIAMGDLLLEYAPMGRRGDTSTHVAEWLASLSNAVGGSPSHESLSRYRRVSWWFDEERRAQLAATDIQPTWTVLRRLALRQGLHELPSEMAWSALVAGDMGDRVRPRQLDEWVDATRSHLTELAGVEVEEPDGKPTPRLPGGVLTSEQLLMRRASDRWSANIREAARLVRVAWEVQHSSDWNAEHDLLPWSAERLQMWERLTAGMDAVVHAGLDEPPRREGPPEGFEAWASVVFGDGSSGVVHVVHPGRLHTVCAHPLTDAWMTVPGPWLRDMAECLTCRDGLDARPASLGA